jgi:uncharacterized protein YtpQ (UPF0354 family)
MNSSLSRNEFLLQAIATVKASQPLHGAASVSMQGDDAPVLRDLGNGLFVAYLVDDGDNLVYVQNHHLQGTQLTNDGLYELGLHNLAVRSAGKARMQQHGDVHAFQLDGLFEASLILLDDLWDNSLSQLAPNGFVAALPARDVLAVCDAQSAQGIESLRNMANRVFAGGDHLLVSNLFKRQNGKWIPLP